MDALQIVVVEVDQGLAEQVNAARECEVRLNEADNFQPTGACGSIVDLDGKGDGSGGPGFRNSEKHN